MTLQIDTDKGFNLITAGDLYGLIQAGGAWEIQGEYGPHGIDADQIGNLPSGALLSARQVPKPDVIVTLTASDAELIRDGILRLDEGSSQDVRLILARLRSACACWRSAE